MISYIVKCIVIGYEHTQFLIIPYWKTLKISKITKDYQNYTQFLKLLL